jgi:hypothetical protein
VAKYLSADDVAMLAVISAESLGMNTTPTADALATQLKQFKALPEVFSDGLLRMWVDKLYIAYSFETEETVHYIYLTDLHIKEEQRSYALASRLRGRTIHLPSDITEQFRQAVRLINEAGDEKKFVIFEKVDSK